MKITDAKVLSSIKPTSGLECEALRVTAEGVLSTTEHPAVFGNKLNNPYFTTDYAEQQLEMITPPLESLEETYDWALALSRIAQLEARKSDERLWPCSMPCPLPAEDEIQIARYDDSEAGRAAYAYRELLAKRYSKARQMLSGVHFNLSFNDEFLRELFESGELEFVGESFKDFKNFCYLKVARNFNRFSWLPVYLFGVTPFYHNSFVKNLEGAIPDTCEFSLHPEPGLCLIEQGVSARNGDFGYRNVSPVHPDYSTLASYITSLRETIDAGIISAAKEYYSPLRLKSYELDNVLDSLERDGVAYVELRLLDVNPFDPARISLEDMRFITAFIHYLLFCEESQSSANPGARDEENRRKVASQGLDPELMLMDGETERSMKEWALSILEDMREFCSLLDESTDAFGGQASAALESALERVNDPSKTYASRLTKVLTEEGFVPGLIRLAHEYQEQAWCSRWLTAGFECWEMSTQLLIAEALKRGIKVTPIDEYDNIILLEKDGLKEYVRQCTKTSRDSYISVLLMENKVVSKRIMAEAGLVVPRGSEFEIAQAERSLKPYVGKPCVVKPKSTNFGTGVVMFPEGASLEALMAAAEEASKHDKVIMVEDFMPGPEYRYLVIGGEAVGVLQRVPALVTGDGVSTIAELAKKKNEHPYRSTGYRSPLINISLSPVEAEFISRLGYTFDTVPARDEVVYLRPNSNISTGGESIDKTKVSADIFKEIAVAAAQAFDAHFCGVDIIIDNIEDPNSSYGIIEVNFNPAIHIHSFPLHGEEANIAVYVLAELGFTIEDFFTGEDSLI